MMMTGDRSPLGKATDYPDRYDPSRLFTMARAAQREALGIVGTLPFSGVDLWTAYEISWLDTRGKPQLAIGEFRVPAGSPAIVESKSLKLYLGSFAQERLMALADVARMIETDLTRACGAPVAVVLTPGSRFATCAIAELPGDSLDALDVVIDSYAPDRGSLTAGGPVIEESLRTALFRSNCPVTGQPDYGDVLGRYRGPRVDRQGLLRYLISYRQHAAFHETCVERIFIDIAERCQPERLTVYARFTRRGGIDINPFRSNFEPAPAEDVRTPRQ